MLRATLGELLPIQVQLGSGETGLFPRAKVYDITGSLVATLSLSHVDGGLYSTTYTFNTSGFYTAVYEVYTDAGFTTQADYDSEAETIEANSDKTNLIKVLGLTYDNSVLDNHVYNVEGLLLEVRVRNYDSKANAILAGATGLVNTWNITAEYIAGKLSTYTVLRD